jgi:hypothetical protein
VIVRILGEGQLRVEDSAARELNELDAKLEATVERNDESAFQPALDELLARVRAIGRPVEPGALEPSELILPGQDASMDDVRKLLAGEGLIPG